MQFRRITGISTETAGSYSSEQKEPIVPTWRRRFPFHKTQSPECIVVDQYAAQTWVKLRRGGKSEREQFGNLIVIRSSMSKAIRKS